MGDRRISCKFIGKVISSCVSQIYMNAPETMALKEKQQEKVHVCEKKKLIVGVNVRLVSKLIKAIL